MKEKLDWEAIDLRICFINVEYNKIKFYMSRKIVVWLVTYDVEWCKEVKYIIRDNGICLFCLEREGEKSITKVSHVSASHLFSNLHSLRVALIKEKQDNGISKHIKCHNVNEMSPRKQKRKQNVTCFLM